MEKDTILLLSQGDRTVKCEMPWDVPLDELVDVFAGLCEMMTYQKKTIIDAFASYIEENTEPLTDNYESLRE